MSELEQQIISTLNDKASQFQVESPDVSLLATRAPAAENGSRRWVAPVFAAACSLLLLAGAALLSNRARSSDDPTLQVADVPAVDSSTMVSAQPTEPALIDDTGDGIKGTDQDDLQNEPPDDLPPQPEPDSDPAPTGSTSMPESAPDPTTTTTETAPEDSSTPGTNTPPLAIRAVDPLGAPVPGVTVIIDGSSFPMSPDGVFRMYDGAACQTYTFAAPSGFVFEANSADRYTVETCDREFVVTLQDG